jgi:hypothetical protein
MNEINVLAVSASEQGVLSAHLTMEDGRSTLTCGRSYPEALEFLRRHPGAIILCKGTQNPSSFGYLSALVRDGHPSAVISICPTETRYRVDLQLIHETDALQQLGESCDVLSRVFAAWEYCVSLSTSEAATKMLVM